jgi:anaerobic magnesium-protoporphyrin IX monomethyl ester cyclase
MKTLPSWTSTFPDVGLLYAASVALAWGAEGKLWDGKAERIGLTETIGQIRAYGPDLLAFPIHAIPSFADTITWIKEIKREIGKPVLVGGYEFGFLQRACFVHPEIDFGLYGETVRSLPEFLDAFCRGGAYARIKGLIYREDGETVLNPPAASVPLDEFPFPARQLLKNSLYFSHVSQHRNYTVIVSSRGCPFRCSFCAIASTGFDARSPESVVEEMRQCHRDFDIREFDFFDPLMLHDRERAIAIAEGILHSGMNILWSCRSRTDTVDKEMLAILARSGLVRIFYGIESGEEGILRKMNKGCSLVDIRRVIEMTNECGIRPLGFFQIGAPGDTEESARKTIAFAKSLPLDYAQFMRTIAKPRSELEKQVNEALGYNYWSEYVMGRKEEMRLPSPWTELSSDKIEKLIREAYFSFYFRPAYMVKMLRKVSSLSELRRYFLVAMRMLLRPSGL